MTYDQRTIYQALCDRICIPIQLIFVIYNKSASVLEISVTHILPTEGYTFMLSEDNATLQILFWYALIVFWNVAWIQNIHITYTYTYTYITHAYYTYYFQSTEWPSFKLFIHIFWTCMKYYTQYHFLMQGLWIRVTRSIKYT